MTKFRQILLLTSEANLMLKLRCQETVHTSKTGRNLWTECVNGTITVILITGQIGIDMT